MDIGKSGRVQVEDILYLVRKDKRKYARVKELLNMNEELKKARKAFDEVKYAGKFLACEKCLVPKSLINTSFSIQINNCQEDELPHLMHRDLHF